MKRVQEAYSQLESNTFMSARQMMVEKTSTDIDRSQRDNIYEIYKQMEDLLNKAQDSSGSQMGLFDNKGEMEQLALINTILLTNKTARKVLNKDIDWSQLLQM